MNAEVEQLKAELDRIGKETSFNGKNLFDANKTVSLQVGNKADQSIDLSFQEVSTSKLGAASTGGVSAQGTDNALANGDLEINNVKIGPSLASSDTASTDNAAASAISKVAAINAKTSETGVTATVNTNTAAGSSMTAAALNGSVTVNGVSVNVSTSADASASRAAVMDALNAVSDQTGVTVKDSGTDNGGLIMEAKDGRNIQISFTTLTAASTGLAAAGTYEGGYTLTSSSDIKVSGGNGTGNGDIANSGLTAGTYGAGEASVTSVAQTNKSTSNLDSSFFKLGGTVQAAAVTAAEKIDVNYNGTTNTIASVQSAQDLADGIEANANITYAEGRTEIKLSSFTADTSGDGTLTFGGQAVAADDADEFVAAVNTNTTLVGAGWNAAKNEDGTVSLTNDVGANFNLTAAGGTGGNQQVNIQAMDDKGNFSAATAIGSGAGLTTATAYGYVEAQIPSSVGSTLSFSSDKTAALGAASGAATVIASEEALVDGDMVINGTTIRASDAKDDTASYTGAHSSDAAASGIALAAAINASSADTGVTAKANETVLVGTNGASAAASTTSYGIGQSGDIHINGVNVGTVTLADNGSAAVDTDRARADAITAINSASAQTGVTAEDNGKSITLRAADGRNISVAIDNNDGTNGGLGKNFGLAMGLDSNVEGIGEADIGTGAYAVTNVSETTYSSVTLSSAGKMDISGGTNGAAGTSDSGLASGSFGGAESGQYIKDIDISTVEGAKKAIDAIDNALDQISEQRSLMGATSNRLDFTIDNLSNTVENATAARSRIQDADFAAESANLSRAQVLQQASQSMLAQANSAPQQVLSLLQ